MLKLSRDFIDYSQNMQPNTFPLKPLFDRIVSPLERFLRLTTAGGIVLMVCTAITLVIANSPWGALFHHFWDTELSISFGTNVLRKTLHHWVNDGLMVFFFLLVGLELKREILVGELSSIKEAILPVSAAAGGMLVPAFIYLLLNYGKATSSGWGIPMATDIAFAVGILVLLSWRIPKNLIIFLIALAIADDLGAVMVIAFFYTAELNTDMLQASLALFFILVLLNRGGVRHPFPYILVGFALWYTVLLSGIHATIAGILLALAIPARSTYTLEQFDERVSRLRASFREETTNAEALDILNNERLAYIAQNLERASSSVQSPLQRTELSLHPWVTFIVIPLFALANAGIDFRELKVTESITQPITMGIVLGLVLGKFIGISLFSWLCVKLGLGRLPKGVKWRHILGAAWLGGIGFTMSLFIAQLAFSSDDIVEQAKFGILLASLISAVIGLIWLFLCADRPVTSTTNKSV